MIYFNWPPGPFLATQYDKEPGGAGFEANLSHAFYFRTEAAGYEIYKKKLHTKYSGFTVAPATAD